MLQSCLRLQGVGFAAIDHLTVASYAGLSPCYDTVMCILGASVEAATCSFFHGLCALWLVLQSCSSCVYLIQDDSAIYQNIDSCSESARRFELVAIHLNYFCECRNNALAIIG